MEEVKYRFTAIARNSTKEVFPQNGNTLSVSWEKEEENAYFRKKLKGKMLFVGADFHWLYVFESSQYRCDPIQLVIEKNCSEGFNEFFVARLILNNADWDLDQCTVSIETEVEDKYTCYNDNKGKEQNLISITYPKQVVGLIQGDLEYKTCSGSDNDPQWCGAGEESDGWVIQRYYRLNNNPDSPDPAPSQQTFTITYVREVITSATPLGAPWVSIGGDNYARQPALYGYRSYGGQYDFGYEYQVGGSIDNGMKLYDAIQALINQSCYTMKLKSNFFNWNKVPVMNENILDPKRSTAGAKLNINGAIVSDPDPNRKVTDYLRVIPGGQLWLLKPGTLGGDDKNGFYDINKNFVMLAPPVIGATTPIKIADIPLNVEYVRYQYYDRDIPGSELMLYMGTQEVPFQAYNYNNYVTGLPSKVDNLILFQKSDVKRPSGSNNATISNITLEKMIKDICNMFNLRWDIDEDGSFVLEHVSFFQKGVGLNLIGRRDSRLREGLRKYSYDVDNMPRREVFQMMDEKYTYGDFRGVPIIYSNSCVGQGEKEDKDWIVETIMTDVSLALNNPNSDSQVVSDDGFILMACDQDNNILSEDSILGGNILNNTLAWSHLHYDYWRHQRVFNIFNMNNVQTAALSVVPTKKRVPLNIVICCNETFDPEEKILDEMGEGIVSEATFDLYKELLTVTLTYVADQDLVPNQAPVVVDDVATTFKNLTIDIDVLANDSDTDGTINPGTLNIVFGGQNGTSSVVEGKIRYTPNLGFTGDDVIAYNVRDNWNEQSANATVTITVKSGSPLPIAEDDSFRTGENVVLIVGDVKGNDTGDGALSTVPETKQTAINGSVQINSNGSFTYTPPAGFVGLDYFDYTLKDSNNNTDTGRVTIEVFAKSNVFVRYSEVGTSFKHLTGDCGNVGSETFVGDQTTFNQKFEYFSDAAGTTPLDVTGYGISILMKRTRTGTSAGVYNYSFPAVGTGAIYEDTINTENYYGCQGETNPYSFNDTYELLASSQYTKFGDSAPVDPPVESMLIRDYYPYPMGFAMNHAVTRANYLQALKSGGMINPETALATKHTQPTASTFDWVDSDICVNFALANDMDVHGSHLIWANDSNLEGYFIFAFEGQPNGKQLMKDFMGNHITQKIQKYRGKVKSWNAMNEFIKDDGTILNNVYSRLIPDFNELVEFIFTTAITAAPENDYLYNDYNMETGNLNRTNTLIAAMDNLLAKNIFVGSRQVKIDGVGFQFHTFRMPELDMARVETRFDRWFARNLKVAITELDISPTPTTYTAAWATELADRYERIVMMLERSALKYPAGLANILFVCFWSATDRESFWNKGKGAPDSGNPITNHSALHDYYAVRKLAYERLRLFGKNR